MDRHGWRRQDGDVALHREHGDVEWVVFDIGGVLLDWRPELVYAELIPDAAERAWFLAEVCTPEWNLSLDAGRSFEDACAELAMRYPAHERNIHAWKRQADMVAGEIRGTAGLVSALRARGTPLYLLTNMPSHVFHERVDQYDVLRCFDGALVSGDVGLVKPDRRIFELAAARFHLDPSRTLFIDDSPANVAGAAAAGFRTHRFTSAEALREELVAQALLDQEGNMGEGASTRT